VDVSRDSVAKLHAGVRLGLARMAPPTPPNHAWFRSGRATVDNSLTVGGISWVHWIASWVSRTVPNAPAAMQKLVRTQSMASRFSVVPEVPVVQLTPPLRLVSTVPVTPTA